MEMALILAGLGEALFGPLGKRQRHPLEDLVAGEPHDVVHVVFFAPAQGFEAAEAGVTAEDDPHLGPLLAETIDQQLQNRAAMEGGVDVARSQIGEEQMLTAEDVERQEAVVILVSVEEPVLLVAVDFIIGGVEIENEFLGGTPVRFDELRHKHFGHCHE